jgi:flavin reductase (DIM6/NTAB) family NADH-FMN oxidoreductase RutF
MQSSCRKDPAEIVSSLIDWSNWRFGYVLGGRPKSGHEFLFHMLLRLVGIRWSTTAAVNNYPPANCRDSSAEYIKVVQPITMSPLTSRLAQLILDTSGLSCAGFQVLNQSLQTDASLSSLAAENFHLEMILMPKTSLPLSRVYRFIEPGPVVLVSTMRGKKMNVMTMSWHMMVDFEPPIIACVMSNRDYSFGTLKKTGECVINIPTVELAKEVVAIGNTSGKEIAKFTKFGLTPSAAARVRAPLIDECYVNLECKVVDTTLLTKYGIFVLQVVTAWIDRSQKHPRIIHHQGNGRFVVDGEIIKLPSKMK